MIIDLQQHARQIKVRPRSEGMARKDALLLRYRTFSIAVGCALLEIERAQATGDLNASDLITRIAIANIRATQKEIKDV